ncbi:MAG: outer membrane beta-barrel domain-containing protein [Bdellovibrionales bacterium]
MKAQNTSAYGVAVLALVSLMMASPVWAQGKKRTAPPPAAGSAPAAPNEKVDISDLENKYWAPKDTDFSVVQNRTYSKEKRFLIAPQWGRTINDSYSEGNLFGVSANYFWSERMGVQAFYFNADLKNNDASNDIANLGSGAIPNHGRMTSYYGVGYNLVPFYAKMSVWGKKIIYFDMAFTPTIGMLNYDQVLTSGNRSKSTFSFGLDITQYFFFSRWFAVRADLRNQWSSQEILRARQSGSNPEGEKLQDKTIHDTMFLIGAAFYF